MRKKILILAGGFSREKEISLQTAYAVNLELKKKKYLTKICKPDGDLIKNLRNFKPNVVFNALHGRYGEDGYIQAILESEKIKYTHSGVKASSIAMDKEISKKIFIKNKILTPKYFKFKFNKEFKKKDLINKIKKKLGFPVVNPSTFMFFILGNNSACFKRDKLLIVLKNIKIKKYNK